MIKGHPQEWDIGIVPHPVGLSEKPTSQSHTVGLLPKTQGPNLVRRNIRQLRAERHPPRLRVWWGVVGVVTKAGAKAGETPRNLSSQQETRGLDN